MIKHPLLHCLSAGVLLLATLNAEAAVSTVSGAVYSAADGSLLTGSDSHNVNFNTTGDATMLSAGGYYDLFAASYGGMTVTGSATGFTSSSTSPYAVSSGGYAYTLNFSLTGGATMAATPRSSTSLSEGGSVVVDIAAKKNTTYAIEKYDSDLVSVSSSVTTDGSGNASFTITAVDDSVYRGGGSESVGITIYDESTGANDAVTLSISDDDSAPDRVVIVIPSASVSEGSSTTAYAELRAGDTARAIETSVSVSIADDSVNAGLSTSSITIPAESSRSSNFTITPVDNSTDGSNFTLTVTPTSSYTDIADTILILDDDETPALTGTNSETFNEDGTASGDLDTIVSDGDGDSLTYTQIKAPGNSQSWSFDGDTGAWSYTPTADYNGSESFQFTASDGANSTTTITYTFTITAQPDAPVIADASDTIAEDGSLVSTLPTATDGDSGSSFTYAKVGDPSNGSVSIESNGSFTYTPTENFNGEATFTYKATDNTARDSTTATYTVTVTAANDDPSVSADAASVDEGASVTIDVLDNDSDIDGDSLSVSAVETTTSATYGTVEITNAGADLSYTADNISEGFTGTDTFTYTASDGNGGTVEGTVTVDVSGDRVIEVSVSDDSADSIDLNSAGDDMSAAPATDDTDADGSMDFPSESDGSDVYEALDATITFSVGEGG